MDKKGVDGVAVGLGGVPALAHNGAV